MRIEVWERHPLYRGFLALFQIFSFLAVLVVLYMYQRIKKVQKEETGTRIMAYQVQEIESHVQSVERFYEEIRGIRHDVRHHVMVLEKLCDGKKYKEADLYVREWKKHLDTNGEMAAVQGRKDTGLLSVEVVDISILLMNALSNAVLAAESSEASFVKVHSFLHRGTYLIEVRNSFDGVLDFQTESGFPETKKKEREKHGYGLFNIKRVAEKYGGAVSFMQEGREVILTVMLLLQ